MTQATVEAVLTVNQEGLADGLKWLRALCKFHGVTTKDCGDFSKDELIVQNILNCRAAGGKRLDAFQYMVRRCEKGFEVSRDWVKDPASKYDALRYISSDGKWRVTLINRYNGSGGYKVATMKVGIVIKQIA